MLPDPGRWPSSNGGKGFVEVAKKVHGMALKFGIHVMRGLSRQAYDANTPIFDSTTVLLLIMNHIKWFFRFPPFFASIWKAEVLRTCCIGNQKFAYLFVFDFHQGRAYEESGRQWRARDIGIKEKACGWMPHGFMSVNTKLGAGRAFLRSLYEQYADWGVDFGNLTTNWYLILLLSYSTHSKVWELHIESTYLP